MCPTLLCLLLLGDREVVQHALQQGVDASAGRKGLDADGLFPRESGCQIDHDTCLSSQGAGGLAQEWCGGAHARRHREGPSLLRALDQAGGEPLHEGAGEVHGHLGLALSLEPGRVL